MKAHMSDGHLYAGDKVRKMCGDKHYILVEGDIAPDEQVFFCLHDAESYCQRKGYDPDVCIKSGDPEIFNRVMEIARWKYRVLKEQADLLYEMLQANYKDTERLAEIRDAHKKEPGRHWYEAMDQENVIKSISEGEGIYRAYCSTRDRANYFHKILYFNNRGWRG